MVDRLTLAGVVLLGAVLPAGCVSESSSPGWFEQHFRGSTWSDAWHQQFQEAGQYLPETTELAALISVAFEDRGLQRRLARDPVFTSKDTTIGDLGQFALLGASFGLGGVNLAAGDRGRSLEVVAESTLLTGLLTSVLKVTVRRKRPQSGSRTSFPSGHASESFAAATFLARSLGGARPGPFQWFGYLFYVPAVAVAFNRVEGSRHFPVDAAAGALLGTLVTNLVYNAHFGRPDEGQPGLFTGRDWHLEPLVEPRGFGFAFVRGF
ncbi:MAG: phosphatase PAP2 family protein [Planctomycetota bacterium]